MIEWVSELVYLTSIASQRPTRVLWATDRAPDNETKHESRPRHEYTGFWTRNPVRGLKLSVLPLDQAHHA